MNKCLGCGLYISKGRLCSDCKDEGCEIDSFGNVRWYNAAGGLHRVDGPAVEYISGTKQWYRNGKLHRLDGPAAEGNDGGKYWYIDGDIYTEEKYKEAIEGG